MDDLKLVAIALGVIASVSIISGFFGARTGRIGLKEFLLANQSLAPMRVSQLLLSTSFSLNGILYQCYLGYKIGLWALLIQGFWAASYILLARYSSTIRESRGLHSFLEAAFGRSTRLWAAICSAVGMTILIGWEFMIGRSTFAGVASLGEGPGIGSTIFLGATISVCLMYTAVGGLRGNAIANVIQNSVKLLTFLLIGLLLYFSLVTADDAPAWMSALTPSVDKVIAEMGWLGLITNIAFSLAWQFVDVSTWQSVVASRSSHDQLDARRALRIGGLLVFVAPGIVGTFIGATLHGQAGLTSDTLMPSIVALLPANSVLLSLLVFVALFATLMSTIDGLLLASSYTLTCDVIYQDQSIEELDASETVSRQALVRARIIMLGVAVMGTAGVALLVDRLGVGLFDLVYWLIVSQLSLIGPVIVGLLRRSRRPVPRMHIAIWAGLSTGVLCISASRVFGISWLETGAGAFTITASLLVSALAARLWRR